MSDQPTATTPPPARIAPPPRQPLPGELSDFDLHLFGQGRHLHAHRVLGAHHARIDGVDGIRFAVWAPHAAQVAVAGDFNDWRDEPMHGSDAGVWQVFVAGVADGARYKYAIQTKDGRRLLKSDPYGREFELRPDTASMVSPWSTHVWGDGAWLARRREHSFLRTPMSIYELHLGSWQRGADNRFLNYREIADRLAPYVQQLGFTHVELLPVNEHPFDGSWGYQAIGLYAPTRRHGTPDDFRYFVDTLHRHGLGVILDWVPAHFPKDAHGLAQFDGQPLYEDPDPLRGEHPDWGTLVFDYGRPQVCNFLLANALFWIEAFHVDGLRVDAVASMLYLDYSREGGEWRPNRYGGRERLEAVDFLRELNRQVHGQHPGAVVIAEESTSWPKVSRPTELGGLGFSMKWDMGWMHDSLDYFKQDPIYRAHHGDKLTFGLMYAFSENFVLSLSHDEVVHLKKALVEKMPGDDWQRFANLRLLFAWMWTRPGKKLLFMGGEFGQHREWNHDRQLDWDVDTRPLNAGLRRWVAALNQLYVESSELHELDFEPGGFEWIDCSNPRESVYVYRRRDAAGRNVVIAMNCTPVPRLGYAIGVPSLGRWVERLNSDAAGYGGSGVGNAGGVIEAEAVGCMNQRQRVLVDLPPLGAVVLVPAG